MGRTMRSVSIALVMLAILLLEHGVGGEKALAA